MATTSSRTAITHLLGKRGDLQCSTTIQSVEDNRFKMMINQLNPNFDIPSEKQLRQRIIPGMYKRVSQHVQVLLVGRFKFCSMATDIWPSQSLHSFISATIHFIEDNWQPKMVV